MTAQTEGSSPKKKKNESRKLKAKTFNNVSKDTFLRLFVLSPSPSPSHTGRRKLLFTLHLQFWVRLAFVPQQRKQGHSLLLSAYLPRVQPEPEPNYYFHEFKLWFALRTFLACPRFDGPASWCKLCLCSSTCATLGPSDIPRMQPHLFLYAVTLKQCSLGSWPGFMVQLRQLLAKFRP